MTNLETNMTITLTLLAACITGAILLYAAYRRLHPKGYDIVVPAPSVLRTDLKFGYFGNETGQVAEVKGHTNLHWECVWHGMTQAADDILEMGCFTVLDVSEFIFEKVAEKGKNRGLRADAREQLFALFAYLNERGALKHVMAVTPLDEPNTNCRSPEELLAACQMIRGVAYGFGRDDMELACIYAAKPESFTCIEQFGLVGVNDYLMLSSVLEGVYQRLVAAKRPDAKTLLHPGGAFGQKPTPWVNWAHADYNVFGIVPFCWFKDREKADTWGPGIRANGMRDAYESVGKAICALGNQK